MANINIRRDVTDPFYRYKMEKLQSKIEGKGNGIKTVIVNLSSVAGSLSRPPVCAYTLYIQLSDCANMFLRPDQILRFRARRAD